MRFKISLIACVTLLGAVSCTKLDEKLQSSILFDPSKSSGNITAAALLTGTYNDLNGLLNNQDQIFSLEENTADECLVPTRGGDWDDNGVWRVLHAHTWTATHAQFQTVFSGLGKTESDALSTLAFLQTHPNAEAQDEALYLRSVAQFYFLDLFGQVPYRTVAEYNAITPAPVMQAAAALDTLVNTLQGIIDRNVLPTSNGPYRATVDMARFLLMKVLLNKQAYLNRQTPANPDPADLAKVISLGNDIINSKRYSLNPNFFNNFAPNAGATATEAIWAWPNNGSPNINGLGNQGVNARWMMTLHYNSWTGSYGSAGWNGFSTVADFYNSFEGHGDNTPDTKIDPTQDQRIGGRPFPGVTNVSGLKPGLLAGQQYDETGKAEVDRHGNPLKFTPDVHLVETDPNTLEITGIRIVKYPPDYNAYTGGNQRNQLQIFRYADVILMVAEAALRNNDKATALNLVNQLRAVRGASQLADITLVNTSNVYDPTTLLAERGRELYWESWRRQDLIRFGVFLKPWTLKTADDPKYLLFPIPSDQILGNPNIHQNPGY
jgi:starch-binding outer membrane protein, SusD/RagB family